MRSNKYLFILLLLLSLVLATCTKTPPKPTTEVSRDTSPLTIWWTQGHYAEETETIKQVVAQWEKKSGIEAELTIYTEDDILKQTQSALEAGNPPDILFDHRADSTVSPRWAWEGKLADVSDVIEPVKELYSSSAIASVYLYNNIAKKRAYYAVPLKQHSLHIHYWRDMLAEIGLSEKDIPKNWDAFWEFWKEAQDTLRQQGQQDIYGIGLTMSAEGTNDTFFQFEQALEAYDVQLLDDKGRLLLDNPKVRQRLIATLNWYTNFYKEGYVPSDAVDWVGADNNVNFLNRVTLMTLNTTLSIPASQRKEEEIYRQQMGTIPFPDEPDGEKPKYLVAVKHLLIFASSKHQEAAKDFLSYLVQPENLSSHVKGSVGRWFPVMPTLWEDSFWKDKADSHVWVAGQQFSEGSTRPLYQVLNPAYTQVQLENIWGQSIERVVVDDLSPEKAIDEAIERIKEIFAEWN